MLIEVRIFVVYIFIDKNVFDMDMVVDVISLSRASLLVCCFLLFAYAYLFKGEQNLYNFYC